MENDQTQILENSYKHIQITSLKLRNAIDRNDMRQVLKTTVEILSELKTDSITPNYYYQLFSKIVDVISPLKSYFKEEIQRGRRIKEFYEAVQQCISVIPRIYLIIIVGNLYIEFCENEKNEILSEILRNINGIQHPIRGFFARFFLLNTLKEKFNDIDLLLVNFKEMNKLWIRIGHLKKYGVKEVMEEMRKDLKEIIAENILRLSMVPNLNENLYKNKILIPILKIIIECDDFISQEFILENIMNTFEDEYNINSIDVIITSLNKMNSNVDTKKIFLSIMNKLSNINSEKIKNNSKEIFEKLNTSIEKIIDNFCSTDNDILKIVELQMSYLKFVINFGNFDDQLTKIKLINSIVSKCYEIINKNCEGRNLSDAGTKIIFNLLQTILDSPLSIFKCKNFPDLMNFMNEKYKPQLSIKIIESLVNKYNIGMIDSKEKMESIIEFIKPMVQITENETNNNELLLNKALSKICKLFYMPCTKDPFVQFEMLNMLKNLLLNSANENDNYLKNKKYVLFINNYINALLLLGYNVNVIFSNSNNKNKEDSKNKIHADFCNKYVLNEKFDLSNEETFYDFYSKLFNEIENNLSLIKNISASLVIKLYLQCVSLLINLKFSNKDKYNELIYSFIKKAIDLITNSIEQKDKLELITLLIGNICTINSFDNEKFLEICNLIEKIGDKLQKRNDQFSLLLDSTKLYYNNINKDTKKISEILNKAKKIAVYAMTNPENTILFIYLLNEYLRLDGIIENFDQICKEEDINEIFEAINNYLMTLKSEGKNPQIIEKIENYYKNTMDLVKKIKSNKDNNERYKLFEKINLENNN